MSSDYRSLGLKVGLEIHVQLNTSRKLFCNCPTKLVEGSEDFTFDRILRPARSETGEVDVAAFLEWHRGKVYRYSSPHESSCLVEADEEPPHEINKEALAIAIAIAMALHSNIVDEIYVQRKIVIDGSNTSGFQRTAIVALGGYIDDEDGRVGIETITIEEDAARKISETDELVEYKLDRLGIPLIEIATSPDIQSPLQAERVAFKIGQLVRLTGKAKRGLGTIRQDLNVSIAGGAKTEIKGVQHLYMISKVIEYEVIRQINLLKIKDLLIKRGLRPESISGEVVNVTEVFRETKSKLIRSALEKSGTGVYAVVLKGFKGLLGIEVQPGRRFGTELSDYARVWSGVKGIIHTDELPGYGISIDEVNELYKSLSANEGFDAIVLVVDRAEKAFKALQAVIERAHMAFNGVPEETRAANPDGTTKFMRPRPGAARMYPETDIPPVEVSREILDEALKLTPEPYDLKYRKFIETYCLSPELAKEILNSLRLDLFEELVSLYGSRVQPTIIASAVESVLKSLKREGVPIENITDEHIEQAIALLAEGTIAKEALPNLFSKLAKEPFKTAREAAAEIGLEALSISELEGIVEKAIEENKSKVLEKGERAFSLIMGEVMKIVRGKIDGKIVAEVVKRKLNNALVKFKGL
ncbi:MAG: Glu-tRNA(Gln) amidotransferase subunit GatE [Sulfolobales archaeon]|nr:Glu-tRNA(Gln) amidotransferase subunit GatE [Sulfolobales archaeon]MCX8198835.1 Glu-tRNA(Gln) amidotransferase subunit GatE [Sulfolobales archaeon]MDW8170767.1 Glu-tRNA(Gln) amidotransferase subunit GatE [Desulfurococcaceae archaeon]